MLILEISHRRVETVWLEESQTGVDWALLTPGTEVELGNGLGVTGENVVTEIEMVNTVPSPLIISST